MYYYYDMADVRTLSDEELVLIIRKNDKEQYAEIVRRYQDKLRRYATVLVHDDQRALDIVQESFIKAYIHLQGFNTMKKFSSWLYRIVHNEAINAVKKTRKEVSFDNTDEIESEENIEQELSKKEVKEKAHICLNNMPVIYSEPLALYYLEDKSYEEMSDILRLPMGTIATRINRAKNIMKKLCQKNK